jgi:hypothetical protein
MAGLNDNLRAAEKAISYVKAMLPLGASNVAEDVLLSGGGSSACMLRLRGSYPDDITFGQQTDDWIARVADAAEYAGCGNCAEQCAVAIEFLLLPTTRIDSLDFMGFDPTFFDHQFLVIGRESDSIVTNISSWGLQTAICDPWFPLFPDPKVNRRAYPAYEARSKMLGYLPAGERTLQVLGRWEIPKPTKKR